MNGILNESGYINESYLQLYYNALDRSNNNKDKAMKLYHYTSTRVLNAILSNGIFRASNIFYLNDKIEYKKGLDELEKVFLNNKVALKYIKDLRLYDGKNWAGIYTISFSKQVDVLQQWITYAKESGVCIELDEDIIGRSNEFNFGMKVNENSYIRLGNKCIQELIYDENDKGKNINPGEIIENFTNAKRESDENCGKYNMEENQNIFIDNENEAKVYFQLFASYFKEGRFSGEGEIRAAFLPAIRTKKSKTKIEYFEQANGTIRPYIDIYFFRKEGLEKLEIQCPIKSIMVGPGGNQNSVFDSIVHRVEYGKSKTWRYSIKELENILKSFVEGCCTNSFNDITKVKEYLTQDWCIRAGYTYNFEGDVIKLSEKHLKEVNSIKLEDSDFLNVQAYLESNYLTSKGVVIKKSSLSYIF